MQKLHLGLFGIGFPRKQSLWVWGTLTRVCPVQSFLSLPLWARKAFIYPSGCSCCSVAQLCLTVCNPMDCSTPGFPVLHYLPELAQTHVHWVGDAIQPSWTLSSPSPPAFNLSQHQGLSQWVCSSHWVAKGLELQDQSLQWIFRIDFFRTDWCDLLAVQGTIHLGLSVNPLLASDIQGPLLLSF